MVFETERLLIRQLQLEDLEGFHDMQGNPKVMQYLGGRGMSLTENKVDLQQVIDAYAKPDNNFWVWAMESRGNGEFIGTCALIVNDKGEQEIGFRMREKFWGQGLAKEVTKGLIQYALQEMNIRTLVAYVDKKNLASVRILEQNLTFEKEFFNEEEQCIDRKYVISKQDY